MGRIKTLKEMIVRLKLDVIRMSIPYGHCPYSYYRPATKHNDCGDIDCNQCKSRFLRDMEAEIRKEVKKL